MADGGNDLKKIAELTFGTQDANQKLKEIEKKLKELGATSRKVSNQLERNIKTAVSGADLKKNLDQVEKRIQKPNKISNKRSS